VDETNMEMGFELSMLSFDGKIQVCFFHNGILGIFE
jgi:hypothetical protein